MLEFLFAVIFFKTDAICFHCYLQSDNTFLTINFIVFDFIILSDLTSDPNNFVEIFIIGIFLVDSLTVLNTSLIVLKMSKSSLSESILINLQPSSCSIAFYFFIS